MPVCKVSTGFPHGFEVSTQLTGNLWFWYLHNIKLYAKQKEMISDEISCFGHAQWSWLLNERLVSSGTAQSFVQFLFWLLDDQVTLFTLCGFCWRKLLTTTETTVTWTSRMWHFLTSRPIQKSRLFYTLTMVNFIGRGWSRNRKYPSQPLLYFCLLARVWQLYVI